MITDLGIQNGEEGRYAELATGQKRRLHLALCLIGDPDIVFLGEPTQPGLDVEEESKLHRQSDTPG